MHTQTSGAARLLKFGSLGRFILGYLESLSTSVVLNYSASLLPYFEPLAAPYGLRRAGSRRQNLINHTQTSGGLRINSDNPTAAFLIDPAEHALISTLTGLARVTGAVGRTSDIILALLLPYRRLVTHVGRQNCLPKATASGGQLGLVVSNLGLPRTRPPCVPKLLRMHEQSKCAEPTD